MLKLFAFALVLCPAVLLTSSSKPDLTRHDKAYYLSPEQVNFVRPGIALKILSAQIAPDGTISVHFNLTDPQGLPLDREGVTTPGAVTLSWIPAVLPNDQNEYRDYATRMETAANGVQATQAATDSGGTYQKLGEGDYNYTFGTKARNFDPSATHTIGVYGNRNLTEFDLGTQIVNATFNFVPNGSPVTHVHDEVRTASCNQCHDPLGAHGGQRQLVQLCVLCHTEQTTDAQSGNTVDFPVMIHKIHMGEDLPSVRAGHPYQIVGFGNAVNDYSTVVFPALGPQNCQMCHQPGAAQADVWLTRPSRKACGSCHDNVNFATGEGHVDLPQISDNQCSQCHIPQGEREFDASIMGAHTIPTLSTQLPGIVFNLVRVDNGTAGKNPTVTFSVKDKAGAVVPASSMNSLSLVMAGPTSDYASVISEDVRQAQANADGTFTYTMRAAVPADAHGSYTIGIEGYRNININAGTVQQQTVRDAGRNQIINFPVDATPVQPRRTVVTQQQCNQCHFQLSAHGGFRNDVRYCVLCHNPNATDAARRPADQQPGESIAFKVMIHKIHTGEELTTPYVIYGFNGAPNNFNEIRFPGDRRDCEKCHVNESETLPLPQGLLPVQTPRSPLNPQGPATAACLGCHTTMDAAAHAQIMTSSTLGESCAVCHGRGADFDVDKVHAR